jgi:hypothetical protein
MVSVRLLSGDEITLMATVEKSVIAGFGGDRRCRVRTGGTHERFDVSFLARIRPRHSWVLNDFRPADGVAFSAPATDSGKTSTDLVFRVNTTNRPIRVSCRDLDA